MTKRKPFPSERGQMPRDIGIGEHISVTVPIVDPFSHTLLVRDCLNFTTSSMILRYFSVVKLLQTPINNPHHLCFKQKCFVGMWQKEGQC
jgi:hypothetical protein